MIHVYLLLLSGQKNSIFFDCRNKWSKTGNYSIYFKSCSAILLMLYIGIFPPFWFEENPFLYQNMPPCFPNSYKVVLMEWINFFLFFSFSASPLQGIMVCESPPKQSLLFTALNKKIVLIILFTSISTFSDTEKIFFPL